MTASTAAQRRCRDLADHPAARGLGRRLTP
jgi:hypothetical protein